MKTHNFLFLFIAMVLLSACHKELTKEEAMIAIQSWEHLPKASVFRLPTSFMTEEHTEGRMAYLSVGGNDYKDYKAMLKFFAQENVVTLKEEEHSETSTMFLFGTTTHYWTTLKVIPTKEGEKYLVSQGSNHIKVRLWDKAVHYINRIGDYEDGKRTVIYTVANTNVTPFGEYFMDSVNKSDVRDITFRLVDGKYQIANY